jgi:DNA-binding CsgD family transcriptional regulator
MSKSRTLSLHEIEAAFQLVQECREMWSDATAWQSHLTRGACRLTQTSVGIYNELRLSPDGERVDVLDGFDCGWRDAEARSHYARMRSDHPDFATFLPRCTRLLYRAREGESKVLLRPEMRDDREWRLSVLYNDYWRPAHLDEFVLAFHTAGRAGSCIMLSVNQAPSDRRPNDKSKAILSLLVRQVGPLVGTTLASGTQPGLHQLSPRLRDTLRGLLAGEAEKQIAARLGLSRTTLHDYVGEVYRRFGVAGRAELMAHFIQPSLSSSSPPSAVAPLPMSRSAAVLAAHG